MGAIEFWAIVAFAAICVVWYVIHAKSGGAKLQDRVGGKVVPLDDLATCHSLGPGIYAATLIRQSGNVQRDLGEFASPDAAIMEASKAFRRAKIDEVRITYSDDCMLAACRRHYKFRGQAEGKKLAGVIIQKVASTSESTPLDELECRVNTASKDDDNVTWNMKFDYHCRLCGGTEIDVKEEKADESPVTCKSCGFVFGDFRALKAHSRGVGVEYLKANKLVSVLTGPR